MENINFWLERKFGKNQNEWLMTDDKTLGIVRCTWTSGYFHKEQHNLSVLVVRSNFVSFSILLFQRFSVAEERRISQEIELQSYLNNLILDDKKR